MIYNKWLLSVIWYSTLSAVCFVLFLYYFILFLYRRDDKFNLFFSLFSLSLGLWIIGYKGIILLIYNKHWFYILTTYLGSLGSVLAGINFFQTLLKQKKFVITRIFEITYTIFLIFICIELILTGTIYYFRIYLFIIYIISTLIWVLYAIALCAIGIKRKTLYSVHLTVAVSLFVLSYIFSIFRFLGYSSIDSYLIESFVLMSLIFAAILGSRFSQVYNDLQSAHSDLLVLDKMKDDFLSTTTHELRTPLHGIMGIADSLADGTLGDLNGRQKENLDLIRLSAGRLNSLVSSILDFSKLRAGRADLFIDEVSLGDVITSVVSLLQASVKGNDIEFITDIGPLPKVHADLNRIYQVLINLVGNAIKFTDRGTVTVRAALAGSDTVRVEVKDTGAGIAPEDLSRIWSPFAQGGDVDTRRSGGAGLGLPITKHLVELHGGKIWAESEKGKGSVFIFEIPVKARMTGIDRDKAPLYDLTLPWAGSFVREEHAALVSEQAGPEFGPAPDDEGAESEAPHRAAPVIVAVDDDPVNLKVIENLCHSSGYKILTAADGPSALDVIEKNEVDLVLLDLMLPGMSGYDVCRKIRRMEKGRYVPVIMVTARDQMGDLSRGFKTGANDYITKPFKNQELALRIDNQLAIKQMLDMEKSIINGLRREKASMAGLYERSADLKESALHMLEWERVIKEDLGIARAFQNKLMTHERPIDGIETSVHFHPIMDVGGDVYDIVRYKPGIARVFMADATGHGITASLNTVKILTEYAAVKHTLGSPAEIINFLNQRFTLYFKQYGIVFACVVADIDIAGSDVTISSAGMPPQFIRRGAEIAVISPMNPIIGLSAKAAYREERHALNRGDILFLHSDGINEIIEQRKEKSEERPPDSMEVLANMIASVYPGVNLDDAGDEFIRRFGGTKNITVDDVTFITVKKLG